jgi:hypothetical protein
LTTVSLSAASWDSPRFVTSMMTTSCSRALIRNRYRRAPTPCDLPDGRLDVVARAVTPIHDQKVLDAADDEQLIINKNPESPVRSQGPSGAPADGATSLPPNVLSVREVSANNSASPGDPPRRRLTRWRSSTSDKRSLRFAMCGRTSRLTYQRRTPEYGQTAPAPAANSSPARAQPAH